MTKEVLVSIAGNQLVDGENDNIELVSVATYYLKNGRHYVLFDEIPEDNGDVVKNTLKFNAETFEMIKKGSLNTQMVFDPKSSNTTIYSTPAGMMNIETITTEYTLTESEDYIDAYIKYTLEINYSYTSENEILIRITPRS